MSKPDLVLRLEAPKEFLEAYPRSDDDPFGKLERLMHDFFYHEILDIYMKWVGRHEGVGYTGTEVEEGNHIECDYTLNAPCRWECECGAKGNWMDKTNAFDESSAHSAECGKSCQLEQRTEVNGEKEE